MAIFARPICQLLLYNQPEVAEEAAPLLTMLSLAIAFSGLLFTTNAILQSFGRATRPVIDMAVGGVVRLSFPMCSSESPRWRPWAPPSARWSPMW